MIYIVVTSQLIWDLVLSIVYNSLYYMSKEIRLSQISHKNYALSLKNFQWAQCSSLISIIKVVLTLTQKYGGRWNPSILQFEFPLTHTSDLIKQIRQLDERLIIKDIPSHLLKNLFVQNQMDDLDRNVVYLPPKNQWNRFLILDYFLVLRYPYIGKFATTSKVHMASIRRLRGCC